MTSVGSLLRDRLEVFEDAASRPVDVCSLVEDHVDERASEEREAPDRLHLRRGEEGRRDGVGDLVLDEVGAPSRPFRIDDDLSVGEVGDGVERDVLEGIVAPGKGKEDKKKDDELVPGAILNNFRYHCVLPFVRIT